MFFPLLILTLFMLVLGAVFPAVYWFNVIVGLGLIALGIKGNIDKKKAAELRALEYQKAERERRKLELEFERAKGFPSLQSWNFQATTGGGRLSSNSRSSSEKKTTSEKGTKFEADCARALAVHGWKTEFTQGSGDQGVDIIATKPRKKVAIQCKFYAKPVGNKAVQEALAGKHFIGADFACVITNSKFTRSAKKLAEKTGVILLNVKCVSELASAAQASRTQKTF